MAEAPPDLVLLDVRMPGLGGFETCRQLRANATLAAIPIIFISALAAGEDIAAGFECGGVDYITKPLRQAEVLARVRTHIALQRAQAELAAARTRYVDLYDRAPVGYVTLSEPGVILEANLTAAAMLGVAREVLVGRALSQFILKDDQDRYDQHRQHLLAPPGPSSAAALPAGPSAASRECEVRLLRGDGSTLWVRPEATLALTVAGAREWRVVLEGIAERKRVEAEKDRLEARLRQTQKLESVGLLAGGVAHEFNNKLMGIMGYVELCRETLPPEQPSRGYLEEITTEARHLADIARQLLAFAGKQPIAPAVLNLNDAVAETIRMLRRLLGEDIELCCRPGANLWPVKIDPGQLAQVLTNLCVNAREAIVGAGRVTIATATVKVDDAYCAEHPEARPGAYVRLAVSDSGAGMSKEALAHLFEPFFTTKDVGKGPGLGLASVYGIVRQNHGHLEVCSELGQGTTFSVYLPPAVAVAEAKPAATSPAGLPRGHETILLTDDEKSVRVTARLFLEALGYTVLAAETPDEALRLARALAGPIHLLITDVIMPGMNGPDLAAQLTAQRPGLKCLFMSGYTAEVIAQRGTLAAGGSFLPKPFSRNSLARQVRALLDGVQEPG